MTMASLGVLGHEVVDLHDGGVAEAGGQPGLAAEALPLLGGEPGVLPDALDGDPALQAVVPGEEHLSHAATPDRAFHPVDADVLGHAAFLSLRMERVYPIGILGARRADPPNPCSPWIYKTPGPWHRACSLRLTDVEHMEETTMQLNPEENVINRMEDEGTSWYDSMFAMASDLSEDGPCGPEPVPYPPDKPTP